MNKFNSIFIQGDWFPLFLNAWFRLKGPAVSRNLRRHLLKKMLEVGWSLEHLERKVSRNEDN